jgi:hypothetical protein
LHQTANLPHGSVRHATRQSAVALIRTPAFPDSVGAASTYLLLAGLSATIDAGVKHEPEFGEAQVSPPVG